MDSPCKFVHIFRSRVRIRNILRAYNHHHLHWKYSEEALWKYMSGMVRQLHRRLNHLSRVIGWLTQTSFISTPWNRNRSPTASEFTSRSKAFKRFKRGILYKVTYNPCSVSCMSSLLIWSHVIMLSYRFSSVLIHCYSELFSKKRPNQRQPVCQCRNLHICTTKFMEILCQCRNLSICTATFNGINGFIHALPLRYIHIQ